MKSRHIKPKQTKMAHVFFVSCPVVVKNENFIINNDCLAHFILKGNFNFETLPGCALPSLCKQVSGEPRGARRAVLVWQGCSHLLPDVEAHCPIQYKISLKIGTEEKDKIGVCPCYGPHISRVPTWPAVGRAPESSRFAAAGPN